MKNRSYKRNDYVKKKEISPFYNAVFFSRTINGLSPRGARIFLSGRVARVVNAIGKSISYSSTRTFGCAILSFGLLSLLLNLAQYYFSTTPVPVSLTDLLISAIFALVSIPLLLFDKPMCRALQEFAVTDFIFFDFFSIKRMPENRNVKSLRPFVGVFVGALPAIFGFFFSMELAVLIIVSTVFVIISFISPEFPLIFTVLALPYLSSVPYSEVVLLSLSGLCIVSFFSKVLLGKRFYVFGISDILILLFAMVIMATGVIGGGSESTMSAWTFTALALIYIPLANIIVNRRLAECAVNSVIVSAIPLAVWAIVEYAVKLFDGARTPSRALMSSPDTLATLLVITAILLWFTITDMRPSVRKGVYITFFAVCILALITTECVPVLILLLLLIPAYFITVNLRAPKELLVFLFALPLGIFFIPESVLTAVSEAVPVVNIPFVDMRAEFIEAWQLFRDNIITGIGAVGFSTSEGYPLFNAPLGIACRFGVLALVFLAVSLILRMRQVSVYAPFIRRSSLRNLCNMSTLSIFAMLLLGWFCDIFADKNLYCLAFVIFSMSTASLRASKREHQDRLGYYGDQRSFESSVANITLRK